jgi:enoyl-CoA hydratase
MAYDTILYQKDGGVGIVTVNRPASLNALNSQVYLDLYDVFSKIEGDDEVKAVILTGSGEKAFVAGTDIMEMKDLDGFGVGKLVAKIRLASDRIDTLSKPVIAAINGYALGGGCELAMCCDMRVASAKAKFGQPEVNLGIIPGAGGTQRLPRLVGVAKAKELILTGDMIDAETALTIGLVNKVVPPESLMAEARAMADKIASKSSPCIMLALESIDTGINSDLSTGLNCEEQCICRCFDTEDKTEGMNAFAEKRKAEFKNR